MEGNVVPVILSAVSMTLCRVFLTACVVMPYQTVMPQFTTMAYISELAVTLENDEEQNLTKRGFTQIKKDLNTRAGGKSIYLWYKKGPTAITKLQVTFSDGMATGLTSAGYTKINKDLNDGAPGNNLYLWYYQGSGEYDTPIVDIDVTIDPTNEAAKFRFGWERLACDLNRNAGGAWIHLWVKRENPTYISDITATNSNGSDTELLGSGFIRVDEDTNRGVEEGSTVFIWYRQTTNTTRALTDLQVSISDEEAYAFQQQGYTTVNVNLNDGTWAGNPVYLWYKKGGSSNPIKAITIFVNTDLVDNYGRAGLNVINKDLNTGNSGSFGYLCVNQ